MEDHDIPVWDLVRADIDFRDRVGTKTYKKKLVPFNGKDALWEAYEEALDLVVYLRQFIYEQDVNKGYEPEPNKNKVESVGK